MRKSRLVEINYRIRTVAFAYSFLVIGLHLWERGADATAWALLGLQFLVYPHVLLWRARRASDPRRAELANLLADSALLGAWTAALGFPAWIAYGLFFSTTLNNAVTRGWQGAARSVAWYASGALLAVAFGGFQYAPGTSASVTALCFFGALAYTLAVGNVVHLQNRRLRAAAEELRASEERYRLISENAGDLVAMTDREGRWLYTSPSYAKLLAAEDLARGADAFRRVHEDEREQSRAAVLAVARTGESCRLRMRLQTACGAERRLDTLARAVRGRTGETEAVVLASQDVTELTERERQLELASHAFDRMAEAMMITSVDGRVLTVNRAFSSITGYASSEVVGRSETEFRSAMQPKSFWDELYAEVARSGHWSGSTWSQRRDGSLYREWRSVSAVRDDRQQVTHHVTLFHVLDGGLAAVRSA